MESKSLNISVNNPINEHGPKGNLLLSVIVSLVAFLSLFFSFMIVSGNFTDFAWRLDNFIRQYPFIIIIVTLLPLLGVGTTIIGVKNEKLRDYLNININLAVFMLLLSLLPSVIKESVSIRVADLLGYGLFFNIDILGITVATLASFIWLMVSIYAPDYMNHEGRRNRFYLFLSVTYTGILGTVLSGDLFTTFLFFEIMTFSSYLLVVHTENKEALNAGDSYIYMGIMGGLSILLGIILLFVNSGTLEYSTLAEELKGLGNQGYFIMTLFVVGFGVKAGMVPLHIWLPKAHPVAPTPASALLSGIMVKIGAYGILRTIVSFTFPGDFSLNNYDIWSVAHSLGNVIIWFGIGTMGIGIFLAMQQNNIKRMLAYSTVSQMGLIIAGIGVTAYLGPKGAMGFSGALYHIINHALYKSLLFMVAGAVYLRTHTLDITKMGGLWRKMPITFIVSTIAVLGITGMPFFNGYVSKTLVHHGITEAHYYGDAIFRLADYMFIFFSGGTACVLFKWTYGIFFGSLHDEHNNIKEGFQALNIPMIIISAIIIAIGLFPSFLLDNIVIPSAKALPFDPAFITKYIEGINIYLLKDLMGIVYVYIIGTILFILGIKGPLFSLKAPKWFCVEGLVTYPIKIIAHFFIDLYCKLPNKRKEKVCITPPPKPVYEELVEHESVIHKFVEFVDKQVCKLEMPFIKSDILLYSILLTFVLLFFFIVK